MVLWCKIVTGFPNLFFAEEEAVFTKNLHDLEVNENETVRLICEISKPNAEVTWFKGDEEVPDGGRFEYISDGRKRILVIRNAHPEDAGKYTCKLPSSSTTGKLTVHGKRVIFCRCSEKKWSIRPIHFGLYYSQKREIKWYKPTFFFFFLKN